MARTDGSALCREASGTDRKGPWRPHVDAAVQIAIHRGQTCPERPRFDGESGRMGRVVKVDALDGAQSHPYLVVLHRVPVGDPLVDWRMAIVARYYAADELRPVDS